jgi:hypothetical protein
VTGDKAPVPWHGLTTCYFPGIVAVEEEPNERTHFATVLV